MGFLPEGAKAPKEWLLVLGVFLVGLSFYKFQLYTSEFYMTLGGGIIFVILSLFWFWIEDAIRKWRTGGPTIAGANVTTQERKTIKELLER